MKLLSWNVNGRVREALRSQLSKLVERAPDIAALQEVTRGSYEAWCEGLTAEGYSESARPTCSPCPTPIPPSSGAT